MTKSNEKTAQQRVFEALEADILSGAFQPGDPLVEARLCEKYGASRTPLREALRKLELEGLVHTVPNRGAVVEGVTHGDVRDIYAIRILVEGLAAKWAAERIGAEESAELKLTLELQEFYLAKNDSARVLELDSRFHGIINNACNSKIMNHTLTGFHHYIERARFLSMEKHERALASAAEHRAVYEAIHARDGAAAERAMTAHIQNALCFYMKEKTE